MRRTLPPATAKTATQGVGGQDEARDGRTFVCCVRDSAIAWNAYVCKARCSLLCLLPGLETAAGRSTYRPLLSSSLAVRAEVRGELVVVDASLPLSRRQIAAACAASAATSAEEVEVPFQDPIRLGESHPSGMALSSSHE